MKVVSLVGKNETEVLAYAEALAEEFQNRSLKVGLFVQKEGSRSQEKPFHGNVVRYDNQTLIDVGEAFELDSLMSICCCDFLMSVNLEMPGVPKVLIEPYTESYETSKDILCIVNEGSQVSVQNTTPVFNYKEDITSVVSYMWLNGMDMISNKNIQMSEEFVKYADTAQKNVAVVKIKSSYGFEIGCIKKSFSSESEAYKEASHAGILNKTLKIYPQVIDVVKTVLYREFVDGDKLDQVVLQNTDDGGEKSYYYLESILLTVIDTINYIHNELEDHYGELYQINDLKFENFMVTEDTVYYLNLNGIKQGNPVADYEQFAAHILACEALKTNDKRDLINSIISYVNNSLYYDNELKWDGIESTFRKMAF